MPVNPYIDPYIDQWVILRWLDGKGDLDIVLPS